jgi:hypothetical protein
MAKKPETVELDLDQRLRDSKPQPTSVLLPMAIHLRLDALAESAEDSAATRKEIIGMLIADASLDPETLDEKVLAYRKLTNGDVVSTLPDKPGEEVAASNVLSFKKRGRGRPRKAG